jgi:hypothetical protein
MGIGKHSPVKGIQLNYKPFSDFYQCPAKALRWQGFLGTYRASNLSKLLTDGHA